MEEKIKCGCCGYEEAPSKWSLLEITYQASLIGYIYDPIKGKREHIGSVDLYACPTCKTITFLR